MLLNLYYQQLSATIDIVEGKITSFYKDYVLNEQTFCNPEFYEGQVGTMIEELSGRLGEKIYIKKFSRIEVGA